MYKHFYIGLSKAFFTLRQGLEQPAIRRVPLRIGSKATRRGGMKPRGGTAQSPTRLRLCHSRGTPEKIFSQLSLSKKSMRN